MSKKYRLAFMILSIIALVIVGWFINRDLSFVVNDFWFTTGLLLLVLLSLIDQPHFSKDSNIFVNGTTAALSLLLVPSSERDNIFWLFLYFVLYLVISSYILMWLRNDSLQEENKSIQFISRLNRNIGKPEVIFSAFFLWGGIRQYTMNSQEFNALLWFWIIFMILNIPSLAAMIAGLFSKGTYTCDENAIGTIFGVQSKNTFLVKLSEKRKTAMNVFDFVEFECSIDNRRRKGLVLDVYLLNQEQWIKVLSTQEINALFTSDLGKCNPDVVYKITPPQNSDYLKRFIGIVAENSIIEKIKFVYNSNVEICEGQLIELSVNMHKVMYQVVQGITKIEQLENRNESSFIIGEAIQLGEWSEERGRFEQFGWVPGINTPVFLASRISEPEIMDDEYKIGYIPGTNYPVIINKELAVTHHTAILGVTGSGKSVFTRDFIRQIATNTTKVIIVDLTGEYKSRFANVEPVISKDDASASFKAIEAIATEKAKFQNQQEKNIINDNEAIIKEAFKSSIRVFLESDKNETIFELPDISNNSAILEYTKWFFWVLFKIAKHMNNFGKRVCVVLEEAHTIVPELNSMGVSDNASKATVNSIAQIALQGRKYNIGFIVIAQRTANVSKTVLTQCNSIISFQELDKTSSEFLSNYMGRDFLNVLPTLKFKTAIAMGKAFRSTVPIIFEVPDIEETIYKDTPKAEGGYMNIECHEVGE
jgi:hypothetical protein